MLDTVWDHTGRWMDIQVFLDGGVGVVGLKRREQGAYVRTARVASFTVPAFPVTVVDALGAGDAWAGGWLCGLLHGWDLERTARFANAVGACAVQALGAATGIKSFTENLAYAFPKGAVL